MREHTYGHRIVEICRIIGIPVKLDIPKVTLAVIASNEMEVEQAKVIFERQTAPGKHLFIELENFDFAYKFLNSSTSSITYAMRDARNLYRDDESYYGCSSVFKHNLNDSLQNEALEDFIYWGNHGETCEGSEKIKERVSL